MRNGGSGSWHGGTHGKRRMMDAINCSVVTVFCFVVLCLSVVCGNYALYSQNATCVASEVDSLGYNSRFCIILIIDL